MGGPREEGQTGGHQQEAVETLKEGESEALAASIRTDQTGTQAEAKERGVHGAQYHNLALVPMGDTQCPEIRVEPNFAQCHLQKGHSGAHTELDSHGRVQQIWWSRLKRCSAKHFVNRLTSCDLQAGHDGDHVDYSDTGEERTRWHKEGAKSPTDAQTDSATQLEWAKSRNPKMFKTPGRDIASAGCSTASRVLHEWCTEPWCDCPCHDVKDVVDKHNSNKPWSMCLGALALVLKLALFRT